MIKRPVLLGTIALIVGSASSFAQQVAPEASGAQAPTVAAETFSFEIGHATRPGTVYTVSATQPATSKLTGQKVRLKIVETTGPDTTTRYFTLATGKHKTVAELDTLLVDIFLRFIANPSPAPNQELGKIGDLKHGGEVRFVAVSADVLRFDNLAPNEPARASNYSRVDIASLQAALAGGTQD